MGRIVAVGEWHRIQPLAMAGVEAHFASTDGEMVSAWQSLAPDVSVLILTPEAAAVLDDRLEERRDLLVTVMK